MAAGTKFRSENKGAARKGKASKSPGAQKNWLEWLVFKLSLVLIVSVLGYLIFAAITEPRRPQYGFDVVVEPPTLLDGKYQAPFTVFNKYDTIRDVEVEIAGDAGRSSHKAKVTFDYLPRHSERRGVAVFEQDPGRPRGRITSFSVP